MSFQELVTIAPWTFIAQICNLLIQMYLIKRFLFKPVQEILAKRKAMADAQVSDAEKAKNEALELKSSYEKAMANAKAEAGEIVQNATRAASEKSDAMLEEAAKEVARMKTQAEADIAQEKKKAVNELKNEIGGIAMEIASEVVEREINDKDHAALIEKFIRNVGEAS